MIIRKRLIQSGSSVLCCALASMVVWAGAARGATRQPTNTGMAIERKMAELRNRPPELYAFLFRMPKGGDLHNHLAGAVYAESFIRDAANESLCVEERTLALVRPKSPEGCADGQTPARSALTDNQLFGALIDSLSMRDFVPGRESAH